VLIDLGDERVAAKVGACHDHAYSPYLANARVGRLEKCVKRQLRENALDILSGGLLERCIIFAKGQPYRRHHAIL
jgi:hypothetical protein